MNLLALDTSTDMLSIAVQKGGNGSGAGLLERSAPGGAQSSTTLIPLIRELMGELGLSFDELDLIAFGRGPGSFTGLRTACSVAQGLAFGARKGLGVPVLPVDSLLAVAEQARMEHGVDKVLAVLDARMDEVYAAAYRWDGGQWSSAGDYQLLSPQNVIVEPGFIVAGNAQAAYGERLAPDAPHVRALPTAGAMLRLAPQLAASGTVSAKEALPLYIRDKVAQTTAEREQARQAAAGLTASGPQPA
ncbi:MAG: tRNA (adenosine(37)-N6)-threonylcarbamoyltransferase complex dimerization subunit type 1 TsaB [Burkholderiaceae bacterium]|jgi:tRNA threonylcarbamoyladenosine biosynthesis protein TsaB|nr:tRNA (adenosine(37)-N6)-threonylcarbamoyltransferase complex dimerization subunit type 1 TsaB [Burkholderiaceae bacterium]